MVGSVLIDRMRAEGDFTEIEPLFFSTSQAGAQGPNIGTETQPLQDAFHIDTLSRMDILVSCQGGEYTQRIYPALRGSGWDGYWIDAASYLRMERDSVIVLDPVNAELIKKALSAGIKNYIGGNCTVSLMLMATSGLFQSGHVEWLSTMTYQAASGAGARHMRELALQMSCIGSAVEDLLKDPASAILDIDRTITSLLRTSSFPTEQFGAPLAGSLIPWIDRAMEDGSTREEWKGCAETNKILGTETPIPVDGVCVRIGAMRCHSAGLTIKLKNDLPLDEIRSIIDEGNQWVRVLPNTQEATLKNLTPVAVAGTLDVPIGRIRKMKMGSHYVAAFSVGDQLLWGAAEPLRRALRIILDFIQ